MEEDKQGVDTKGQRSPACLSVTNHRWMLRHKAEVKSCTLTPQKNRFPGANMVQNSHFLKLVCLTALWHTISTKFLGL